MDPEILALFTPINESIAALGERVAVIETKFQPLVEQVEKLAADVESLNSGTRYTDDRITEIARNLYTELDAHRSAIKIQQEEIAAVAEVALEAAETVAEVQTEVETPPVENVEGAVPVPAETLPAEQAPEKRAEKKRPYLI